MVINSWFATTLLFKLGRAARLVDETMQFFFAEEFSSQRRDSFVFVNQHGRRDVSLKTAIDRYLVPEMTYITTSFSKDDGSKRRLKSEFAFFQSLSRLLQLIYFVKSKRTLFQPNS